MKKIFLTLFVFGITTASFAQEVKNDDQMTLEQRNELRLKRLTVDLDLNENQQKEMSKIIAEESQKRETQRADFKANKEAGKKITAQERFEMKSKMLDQQKEHKAKMRKLLNEKQFEKWEANQKENRHKMQEMRKHRKHNKEGKLPK